MTFAPGSIDPGTGLREPSAAQMAAAQAAVDQGEQALRVNAAMIAAGGGLLVYLLSRSSTFALVAAGGLYYVNRSMQHVDAGPPGSGWTL